MVLPPIIVCRRLHGAPLLPSAGVKVIEVPPELWQCIASFMDPNHLRGLYSVNPAFFEIAMDLRYRHVDLYNDGDEQLSRKLNRIKDLFVAHRIKSLRIKPWLVRNELVVRQSLRSRLGYKFKSLLNPEYLEYHAKEQSQLRIQRDIKAVMDAVTAFKHGIVEYFVDWDEQPSYHPPLFTSFLSPLLLLASNLQKLTLKIPVDRLKALIPTERSSKPLELHNLRELDLTLCTGYVPQRDIDHHLEFLVVFIHNVFKTLKSLHIATTNTSEYLDLSRFFSILGGQSRLRHFSLSIPLGRSHLSDPSTLRKVLHDHRKSLESLTLVTPIVDPGQQELSASWVVEAIKQVKFPELKTLHLSLGGNSRCLCPVLSSIPPCATTLTTLLLDGRALPDNDVQILLDTLIRFPLHGGIRKLKITVKTLSRQLVDALFFQLARLEDIEIVFKRLAGQRETAFNDFRHHLSARNYTNSQVKRLTLETLRPLAITSLPERAKNFLHADFEHCLPQLEEFISKTLPS